MHPVRVHGDASGLSSHAWPHVLMIIMCHRFSCAVYVRARRDALVAVCSVSVGGTCIAATQRMSHPAAVGPHAHAMCGVVSAVLFMLLLMWNVFSWCVIASGARVARRVRYSCIVL